MKKKLIALLMAVIVLAVLCLLYKNSLTKAPQEEESESPKLVTMSEDDLYQYAFTNDGEKYNFILTYDEGWYLESDEDFDVNSLSISGMAQNLWNTTIERTFEDVSEEALADYGLVEPEGEITIVDRDDQATTYHIGDVNGSTGNVYLYKNEDTSKVYLVSTTITGAYNKDLDSLEDQDE